MRGFQYGKVANGRPYGIPPLSRCDYLLWWPETAALIFLSASRLHPCPEIPVMRQILAQWRRGTVRSLLASALALVIGAGAIIAGCGAKNKPIRIGVSLPLTDPAVLPMIRGADLAIRQINEAGGVKGRPLELVRRDDFGEPDSAVQVAAELYASDVVAVIGSAYSGATITAAPVYNGGRRPLV